MCRKIRFSCALLSVVTVFAMTANGQAKSKPLSFVVKVISVEPSPGFWSGQLEADQCFNGIVVRSSAAQFAVGRQLHIEVPVVSGDPLMSSAPHFDESKVANGKLLWIKATKSCIELEGGDDIKAWCIRPIKR
jgi:hypothetical protein